MQDDIFGNDGYGQQPYNIPLAPSNQANQFATQIPVHNQDQSFMQWLFDYKNQTTEPLRHLWKGEELNNEGKWVAVVSSEGKKLRRPIMNEEGINWSISLIESYISPVFVTSNYDETQMNYELMELSRVVVNSLCLRYVEFDLKKTDIERVAIEIESKVRAIILGARGDGYRKFFSTTQQNVEHTTRNETPPQKPGLFSSMRGVGQRR